MSALETPSIVVVCDSHSSGREREDQDANSKWRRPLGEELVMPLGALLGEAPGHELGDPLDDFGAVQFSKSLESRATFEDFFRCNGQYFGSARPQVALGNGPQVVACFFIEQKPSSTFTTEENSWEKVIEGGWNGTDDETKKKTDLLRNTSF
jgi:hypothetical protein